MKKNLRRTMFYVPGNNPGMLKYAHVFGADSLILDLEDSVSISQKDSARLLVRNMLSTMDYDNCEVTVRINSLDTFGKEDLEQIVPLAPSAVRLPKVEHGRQVGEISEILDKLEKKHSLKPGSILIHPLLESPLGIENAYEIASFSGRVDALTLGGQDLAAAMGVKKTESGRELLYAKQRMVMAAKAAGIGVQDTVYTAVNNEDGLRKETREARDLGFDGKSVIHPSQIEIIHDVYRPSESDVQQAERIVEAMKETEKSGKGVILVDGKMIDAPVLKQAERILELERYY